MLFASANIDNQDPLILLQRALWFVRHREACLTVKQLEGLDIKHELCKIPQHFKMVALRTAKANVGGQAGSVTIMLSVWYYGYLTCLHFVFT